LLVNILGDKSVSAKQRDHCLRSPDFIAGPEKDAALAELALNGLK